MGRRPFHIGTICCGEVVYPIELKDEGVEEAQVTADTLEEGEKNM